jgi:putative glutamine amidotransferase
MITPLIGVTCWREQASFGVWSGEMDFLEWGYVEMLVAAGATPLAIPPAAEIDAGILDRLDGLLIAGGGDVEPHRYGREPGPAVERVLAERDEVELTLARGALERDMPVLGVCRGHQVLAAACGGALNQDISAEARAIHAPKGPMFGDHEVDLAEGSLLRQVLGPKVVVKSQHHQAVEELPAGWVAAGRAPDGMVEAIELPTALFAVGVQWHPEWSPDTRLFEALVERAAMPRGVSV